jgi:hypothetical protein
MLKALLSQQKRGTQMCIRASTSLQNGGDDRLTVPGDPRAPTVAPLLSSGKLQQKLVYRAHRQMLDSQKRHMDNVKRQERKEKLIVDEAREE